METINKKSIVEFFNRPLIIYGFISCFVTVIDVGVSYTFEFFMDKMFANAFGVIAGFIIQYFMASKKVFNGSNMRTLIVFIITFLLGLVLAEGIIYFFRDIIYLGEEGFMPFAVSKAASIVCPFFLTYYLRKKFIVSEKA